MDANVAFATGGRCHSRRAACIAHHELLGSVPIGTRAFAPANHPTLSQPTP
jgi:hypothetical protein